jgi:ankyrin repeat protein
MEFYEICKHKNIEEIKQYYEQNHNVIDINFQNKKEKNKGYLHLSVMNQNIELLDYLLKNKANPNIEDKIQITPLHLAVNKDNNEMVILLLGNGANPNSKDEFGITPIYLGIHKNKKALKRNNFVISDTLILFGADLSIKNNNGATVLHECMSKGDEIRTRYILQTSEMNEIKIINIKDALDNTPLINGLISKNKECLKILLSSDGVNVNILNNKKQNVFHIIGILKK